MNRTPNFERVAWGVVHNAFPRGDEQQPRWVVVMAVTGLGSTAAKSLCTHFNCDPDESVGEPQMHCDWCGVDIPAKAWAENDNECPQCGRQYMSTKL
jgi:hypothetical protein